MNPVGAVGASGLEPVEEDDLVTHFAHRDIEVARVLQLFRELGELVVVGRENRLAADRVVQAFRDGPGDRDAVVGRGAAADFVEQHETPPRGPVEDRARLAHLDHEGGLSPHQIVGRAHPREQPVHRADVGAAARHERTHLREEHTQPHLPQQGRLARHVGAGEQDDAAGLVEAHVVGDERLTRHHPLHDGVAARFEPQGEAVRHLRPHPTLAFRQVGKSRPDVELGQEPGARLHAPDRVRDAAAQRVDHRRLARGDPLLGPEHLRLVFLQLRRDVAFGPCECLAALVVRRNPRAVRVRDFEVIPEDLVEPDLERRDAGARALACLQRRDVLLAAVPRLLQVVELAVVTRPHRVPVGELRRRPVHEGAGQLLTEVGQEVEGVRRRFERDGALAALEATQRAAHVREPPDRIAQGTQLTRGGAPEGGAAGQALQVAHTVQGLAQALAPAPVVHQHLHGVEARVDGPGLDERREQPAAQQPPTHRRQGPVQHLEQRASLRARPQRLDQLQVAAGHLVERQHVAAVDDAGPREVGQAARLQLARVAEQRTRGAQRGPVVRRDAQPVERGECEGTGQVLARQLRIELPRFPLGQYGRGRPGRPGARGNDQLGGLVTGEHGFKVRRRNDLEDQLAGRHVQGGDPDGGAARIQCDEVVVAVPREPVVRQHRPRRDRLDDLAAHQALGELRVLDLLADRDTVSVGDEAPEILRGCLDGHPGERYFGGAAVVAGREREPQLARGKPGVVLEHLVEVAHPEEQERVRMSRLDLAVLLHQGRVHAHGSSTTNGWPPTRARRRCCTCCASSRVAYRPTRTLKKPSSPRRPWSRRARPSWWRPRRSARRRSRPGSCTRRRPPLRRGPHGSARSPATRP